MIHRNHRCVSEELSESSLVLPVSMQLAIFVKVQVVFVCLFGGIIKLIVFCFVCACVFVFTEFNSLFTKFNLNNPALRDARGSFPWQHMQLWHLEVRALKCQLRWPWHGLCVSAGRARACDLGLAHIAVCSCFRAAMFRLSLPGRQRGVSSLPSITCSASLPRQSTRSFSSVPFPG